MTEVLMGTSNIDGVSSERVPFALLNKRQQEVLQCKAEGHTNLEIVNIVGSITVKQVEYFTHSIGRIALNGTFRDDKRNRYPKRSRIAVIGLIQDGITNGYLSHDLRGVQAKPLTRREAEIVELLLISGKTKLEMAAHFVVELSTIRKHIENIHKKLETRNLYHLAARVTYLRVHDALPESIYRREKNCSTLSAQINA
ncbi:MAG: hypothetical protein UU34_C0002G0003 [Candidatus Curtissbacteria bacterium GW2011_GWA1_41_11]|uniref:HTH luxR-type domain-containing protein n=1 Tax=Candidatus Curtissbacteria bacterium GW2011_GWA1_41_11 TaxID=1618409 RepID=A0A0G0UK27_9BACT|nr:MAG: hypothetical protein UU34_C0002G0003 [Candidatus Curtissbacteria bacterium GW2011_GWA1_41_11]